MEKAKQIRVHVEGRVQGVGFRQATLAHAAQFPTLKGWVRNLADGRVEAVIRGDEQQLASMVEWCHRGPRFAQVTHVEVMQESVDESLGPFEIRLK